MPAIEEADAEMQDIAHARAVVVRVLMQDATHCLWKVKPLRWSRVFSFMSDISLSMKSRTPLQIKPLMNFFKALLPRRSKHFTACDDGCALAQWIHMCLRLLYPSNGTLRPSRTVI